uniref:Uncharacterized protein n=1 Tax=Anguilla anguilla TaxID=7936 RepID=A0A0E9R1U4_ANGAN
MDRISHCTMLEENTFFIRNLDLVQIKINK